MDDRNWMHRNQHRVVGVVAAVGVLATTVAVWRAETQPRCDGTGTSSTAAGTQPARLTTELAGTLAHTRSVPLVVDQRLRVLTADDEIWAAPVAAHGTPVYWSCIRMGRTVTGVVADAGPTPTVVAQWSDGKLDGIDARTGAVRWRQRVTPDAAADTSSPLWPMYPVTGLFMLTGRTTDVVLVARPAQLQGFDAAGGRPLWTRTLAGAACAGPGFSTAGTLAGIDVGMTYVFHDTCADVEREIDPATGRDIRAFTPQVKAGDTWRAVPDACVWPNVGCAVFSWLLGSGESTGIDLVPAFVAAPAAPANPPPPYVTDNRGWGTDQVGSPDAAIAFATFVIHVSGVPGVQGWAADGRHLWTNKTATGYLYGDGRRAYEFSPQEVDVVTPATGELVKDVAVTGLTALAGVVVQGDLAVLIGADRRAVILTTG